MEKLLSYLLPFISHRELIINYSGIYSAASGVKPVDRKNTISIVGDLKTGKVKKRRFVELGLEWCDENLGRRNGEYKLKIQYNFSQWMGLYYYDDKLILIRLWDSVKLIDLAEAVIHEYIHYLQFKSELISMKSDELHEKFGYLNNPYEIEARMIASKLKEVCLNSIMAQIVRKL